MLYYYLIFFFVTVGAKLALALLMIYLLLPSDGRCSQCDEETLWLRSGGAGRLAQRLFLGRVQRRWCPACGWTGLARRARRPPPVAQVTLNTSTLRL